MNEIEIKNHEILKNIIIDLKNHKEEDLKEIKFDNKKELNRHHLNYKIFFNRCSDMLAVISSDEKQNIRFNEIINLIDSFDGISDFQKLKIKLAAASIEIQYDEKDKKTIEEIGVLSILSYANDENEIINYLDIIQDSRVLDVIVQRDLDPANLVELGFNISDKLYYMTINEKHEDEKKTILVNKIIKVVNSYEKMKQK